MLQEFCFIRVLWHSGILPSTHVMRGVSLCHDNQLINNHLELIVNLAPIAPGTPNRLWTYITRRPSAAPVNQPWVGPPVTQGGAVLYCRGLRHDLGPRCRRRTSARRRRAR